jgi:hypothetical protein
MTYFFWCRVEKVSEITETPHQYLTLWTPKEIKHIDTLIHIDWVEMML